MCVSSQNVRCIFLIVMFVVGISCGDIKKVNAETSTEENNNSTKEILKASETADPKKVDIVKQIRRVNDDGSYTVGYEAGDGTFKIESRDVLGNVKGTYGYIDGDGEIKRVTYSSTNKTMTTVTSSTSTSAPGRFNRTSSSTTRRPYPTVVYPRGSSTRATVIQPIPKKRNRDDNDTVTETTTHRITTLNTKVDDNIMKPFKMFPIKDSPTNKEYIQSKFSGSEGTMKPFSMLKPVYELSTEKNEKKPSNKANTYRRQLTSTASNHDNVPMQHLQQSAGGDSTDVYGSSIGIGTIRPLYTTTTPRPKLIPFPTIIANRDKLREHLNRLPANEDEQETTIEASSGRILESENVVTSNPVPVIHIPISREKADEKLYRPTYYRQLPPIQFRSREYLRDNPGSPIPIGNQRPYFAFDFHSQSGKEETAPRSAIVSRPIQSEDDGQYGLRQVTRLIPVQVDDRGVPIQGYVSNYVHSYNPRPPSPIPVRQQIIQPQQPPAAIPTPVSTKDLKRLLNLLLIRQQKLNTLMEEINTPGPPYQPLPIYRPTGPQYQEQDQYRSKQMYPPALNYQMYIPQRQAQSPDGYRFNDAGYQQDYDHQQDLYSNQIGNYEASNNVYESSRYVPRRRVFRPNYEAQYEAESSNNIQEQPEYLPADVREALLLKMLMLAINPDYFPPFQLPPRQAQLEQITEMTTAIPEPTRKKVRNIQILGEVGKNEHMSMQA